MDPLWNAPGRTGLSDHNDRFEHYEYEYNCADYCAAHSADYCAAHSADGCADDDDAAHGFR